MIVYPLSDPQLPSIALVRRGMVPYSPRNTSVSKRSLPSSVGPLIHSGPECTYPDPDPDEPIHPFPLA